MRFDKDLWKPSCGEYIAGAVAAQDCAHLNNQACVFISIWLELIQDDRAPATRVLRSLSLPDLLAELRNALRHVGKERIGYRLYAALGQFLRRTESLDFEFPGAVEINRLRLVAADLLSIHCSDDKNKAAGLLSKKWSLTKNDPDVVEKHLLKAVSSVLLHTELECWADWVSINPIGETFHDSQSQTFHRRAEG
jgi:hypothetical protein